MSNVTTIPLSSIEIFRLSGSLWGGETALKADDLDPAIRSALPPKELASLGRKRVYPKGPLENLRTIRYRAYMALRRFGASIFGGDAYALDPAVSPRAVESLVKIKADFEAAKADFLSGYQDRFDQWAAGLDPRWEPVIRAALPPVQEVERRVSFGWQQFRLAPPASAPAAGDTLQEEIAALGESVFAQIADAAKIAWNRQSNGLKDAASWKRGVPDSIRMLVEKARNCALFDVRLGALADALEMAAKAACVARPDAVDVCILKGMLTAVQDPAAVQDMLAASNVYAEACSIGAAAGFMPEPLPAQAAPEPAPEDPALESLLEEASAVAEAASAPAPEPAPAQEEAPIDPEMAALLGLLQ